MMSDLAEQPFAFVAFFLLLLRILNAQKKQAEELLHRLEQSNAELAQAHQQLQCYADEVEELTTMRERTRLARETHDALGHYLSVLHMQLEAISKWQERDPARAIVELAGRARSPSASICAKEPSRTIPAAFSASWGCMTEPRRPSKLKNWGRVESRIVKGGSP
jgi:hypothetical protein